MSSSLAFSVLITFPLNGNTAWYLRSLPCLADPPAESPSTINNSFLLLSLPWAGVSLPLNIFSIFLLSLPFLVSSLAFLAASLASLPFNALDIILVAMLLFSSRKYFSFSTVMDSTMLLAIGVPSLAFVCPSNCNKSSGIWTLIIAVRPSLTSLPSNVLSLFFRKLFSLA